MWPNEQPNRVAKAIALATWCWHRDLHAADVTAWDDARRRRVARAASVNPPSSDATWALVREGLDRWDTTQPGAHRNHPEERTQWTSPSESPAGDADTTSTTTTSTPDASTGSPPSSRDAGDGGGPSWTPAAAAAGDGIPQVGVTVPAGWAALTGLGPVPDRSCDTCGAPAIGHGGGRWRCPAHPPSGVYEWGARLDWTPRQCRRPRRCYCGRCDLGPATPLEHTVVDDRAILASGGRRTNLHEYREAQARAAARG